MYSVIQSHFIVSPPSRSTRYFFDVGKKVIADFVCFLTLEDLLKQKLLR